TLGPHIKKGKHKIELPEIENAGNNDNKPAPTATPSDSADQSSTKKQEPVQLSFTTQRGVVLLNVDPSMAPNDLRERPLTEAARAIVRSGDGPLTDAIRKVSPHMFGDYAKTLPPPRNEPSLVALRPPGEIATALTPQLMRVNASVTDRNGRAISNMRVADFAVYEDGAERQIVNVAQTSEPFNLVLLFDVSGSV